MDIQRKNKKKRESSETKWFFTIFITTFILSIVFSFISSNAITKLSIIPATLMLLVIIFIGIIFDVVGVAVTVAKESNFNAMASRKMSGAKTSIKLIKNSAKVANICADVIGDISGVLSGAIGALISIKLTQSFGLGSNLQFIISALVASLTVGGKAIGKGIAQKNSTQIVSILGKTVSIFDKKNKLILNKTSSKKLNKMFYYKKRLEKKLNAIL
ncbi:MAG TPA: hypothetical protein PK993_02820 [Clostridia bacterium]|nr:hypothetical protein [Clostridia bacterium]